MKKLILILSVILLSVAPAISANTEKEYKRIIEKHDISDQTRLLDLGDNATFWATMIESSTDLQKFNRDLQKNRGAEKEALANTAALPRFAPQFDESVVSGLQWYCDSLLNDMGLADTGVDFSLHVVNSDICDVFTARTETGFAICITSALLGRRGVTDDIVKGYVACEFAHGALRHHERSFYDAAKSRRRNDILAALVIGVTATNAAITLSSAPEEYSLMYDNDIYAMMQRHKIIDELRRLNRDKQMPLNSYAFNYSRAYMYEADLAAYRFMAYIGCGDAYLDGLRILGTNYDILYQAFSEKPNIPARIDFLKYVINNPTLGHK